MLERFPSSLRGAFSRNDPEGGAGSGVSRLRREPQRGRSGTPPARSLRPGAGRSLVGSGATAGGGSTGPRPKIATVERREGVPVAMGRPAFRSRGRRASHARHKREECACRRSIHPSVGVAVRTRDEKEDQPGRRNAGAGRRGEEEERREERGEETRRRRGEEEKRRRGEEEKRRARGREATVVWSRAPRACPFARTCGLFDIVNEREELSAARSSTGRSARARCAAGRRSPPSARPRRSRRGP